VLPFVALVRLSRKELGDNGSTGVIFIDFEGIFPRKCNDHDKERWLLQQLNGKRCVMGIEVCYRCSLKPKVWTNKIQSNGFGVARWLIASWARSLMS
jgi:hypothetical protein